MLTSGRFDSTVKTPIQVGSIYPEGQIALDDWVFAVQDVGKLASVFSLSAISALLLQSNIVIPDLKYYEVDTFRSCLRSYK